MIFSKNELAPPIKTFMWDMSGTYLRNFDQRGSRPSTKKILGGGQKSRNKRQNIKSLRAKKNCGAIEPRKNPLYTLTFAFYNSFEKQFFEKN